MLNVIGAETRILPEFRFVPGRRLFSVIDWDWAGASNT